jgi:hypothetical protein
MPFISIKVSIPKEIVNVEKVRQAIIDAQNRKTKPALVQLFGQTVDGWKNRPEFRSRRVDTSSQLGIRVYPAGANADQYVLVNEGARPHIIRPRRARMLRFQPGYRAGTRPRSLHSSAFARSGQFVTAQMVHHPGFEAREFTQTIADEHESDFKSDMEQAIKDGTRN